MKSFRIGVVSLFVFFFFSAIGHAVPVPTVLVLSALGRDVFCGEGNTTALLDGLDSLEEEFRIVLFLVGKGEVIFDLSTKEFIEEERIGTPQLIIAQGQRAYEFLQTRTWSSPVILTGQIAPHATLESSSWYDFADHLSIKESLELIQRLHPKVERVVFLGSKEALEYVDSSFFPPLLSVSYWDLEESPSGQEIQSLQKERDALFLLSLPEGMSFTSPLSIPAYGAFWHHLDQGLIGGYGVSLECQLEAIREVTKEILGGRVPRLQKLEQELVVDYGKLLQLGAELEEIPRKAAVYLIPIELEPVQSVFFSYELFFNHSAAMLLVEAKGEKILDANQAASNYYGYDLWDMRGMAYAVLRGDVEEKETLAMEGSAPYLSEHRLASGELRKVEIYGRPTVVGDAQVVFLVVQDVTKRMVNEEKLKTIAQRRLYMLGVFVITASLFLFLWRKIEVAKQTELHLRKSQEILRQVTGSLDEALFLHSADYHKVLFVSPGYERVFGQDPKQLEEDPLSFLHRVHGSDKKRVIETLANYVQGGKFDEEFRMLREDNSVGWIWFRVTPVWDAQGKVYRHSAIASDITERKNIETTLRMTAQKLEDQRMELESLYRHMDGEIEKARSIHERSISGVLPKLDGIRIAGFYQPESKLGGDFWNVSRLGSKVVCYLSDVTGHSIDGALMNSFVKTTINAYLSLEQNTPSAASIVGFLASQFFKEDFPEDYFIGISLAVLDLRSFSLDYTSLGIQHFPLVRLEDGTITELVCSGLPLSKAIGPDSLEIHSHSVTLGPGSSVLMYTDGLSEQERNGVVYYNQLVQSFRAHAHIPAPVLLERIVEDFQAFLDATTRIYDDVTVLALSIDAKEAREFHYEIPSDFEYVNLIREEVQTTLPDFSKKEFFLDGLHELVVNAIEHGNRFAKDKSVRVEVMLSLEGCFALVQDEGEGFPWREELARGLRLLDTPERGRGIALTRLLCKDLFYNHKGTQGFLYVEVQEEPGS